ncbi:retrovirus-related pol polyprotein from transposon TNT 1-94 [Tanacetum coccineum]
MTGFECNKFRERQGKNYSGNTYKSNATSSRGNTTSRQARVVKCYNCQGEGHMARKCTQPKRPRNAAMNTLAEYMILFGADVISEVLHSETNLNDVENQGVHAMQDFEQTPVVGFTDNKAQQDSMILFVIEQISEQTINHVNN